MSLLSMILNGLTKHLNGVFQDLLETQMGTDLGTTQTFSYTIHLNGRILMVTVLGTTLMLSQMMLLSGMIVMGMVLVTTLIFSQMIPPNGKISI